MKILIITGPFGSGKTTVSNYAAATLRSKGTAVKIVALDEVSRAVINESQALRSDLAEAFGDHILNDDTSLNRPALAELAFADDKATAKLNALVHPPTIIAARRLVDAALDAEELPIVETPFPAMYCADLFDHSEDEIPVQNIIWTVFADKETRLERGLADGFCLDDAQQRMARQPRMSAYQSEADLSIENMDSLSDLRLEVKMAIEESGL